MSTTSRRQVASDIVDKKVNCPHGGVGSGETSEGWAGLLAAQQTLQCQACCSCGEIFFQWKLDLAYPRRAVRDLYEQTLTNALFGSIDLDGTVFYDTTPLDANQQRARWHNCPCCRVATSRGRC